jgi:hypothetical protein
MGVFDKLKQNWANAPSGTKLQTALGAGQLLYGAFMNNGNRPQMPIPGAVSEGVALARRQAMSTTRPGNEYAIGQINRNAGQSINALRRGIGSGQQLLAGVGQINQNTNQALAGNANQNTLFQYNATQNLQNSLARLGQYQNQQFQVNRMQPYLTSQQTKNMLVGSGIQNLSGAATTRDEMSLYDKVFGGDQPAGNKFFGVNQNPSFGTTPFGLRIGGNNFRRRFAPTPSADPSTNLW